MIKLETLRVFVTVAEAGTIADAGERLGRTGSAISMALKRLEDELGGALFESDRKSRLTPLGAFALETARGQVQAHDAAIAHLRAFAGTRAGRLSVSAVPSVAARLLPEMLPDFLAARPDIQIELFDQDSAGVLAAVTAGRVDFGIAGMPPPGGAIAGVPLFSDRFQLVCSAAHVLASRGMPVRWRDLSVESLILNGASGTIADPRYRMLSTGARKTVHNVTSLFALTKAGVGVTLLPAMAAAGAPPGVAALDMEEEAPRRDVALLFRRDLTPSPVAAAFRDHLLAAVPTFTTSIPGIDAL